MHMRGHLSWRRPSTIEKSPSGVAGKRVPASVSIHGAIVITTDELVTLTGTDQLLHPIKIKLCDLAVKGTIA